MAGKGWNWTSWSSQDLRRPPPLPGCCRRDGGTAEAEGKWWPGKGHWVPGPGWAVVDAMVGLASRAVGALHRSRYHLSGSPQLFFWTNPGCPGPQAGAARGAAPSQPHPRPARFLEVSERGPPSPGARVPGLCVRQSGCQGTSLSFVPLEWLSFATCQALCWALGATESSRTRHGFYFCRAPSLGARRL